MGGSLRKIQAWDPVNGVWVNIRADSNGYLQFEVSEDILKATDLNIDGTKDLQVDVKTSGLPTGAATSAKQDTIITALQLIDDIRNALGSVDTDDLQVDVKNYPANYPDSAVLTKLTDILTELNAKLETGDLNIDGTKDLQVDVKTSGLPTGAATSAKQDIIITALQLIDDLRNALGSVDTDDLQVDVKSQADKERQMLGYDGSTWKKLGMIFNYNDVIGEIISGVATGTTHQLFSTTVPVGEVHIIQNVWFRNTVTNGNILLQIYSGDLSDYLSVQYIDQANIILGVHLDLSNPIVLKAGDKLRGLATECIVDDPLSLQITGYKMLVS